MRSALNLLAVGLLGAIGCGDDASGGGGQAGSNNGGAASGGASAGGGSSSAGWVSVDWYPGNCKIERATDPPSVQPPLEWEPCPGSAAGCERIAVNFPTDKEINASEPIVLTWGDDYRISMMQSWEGAEKRMVVFDTDGVPLVALRTTNCIGAAPRPTDDGVWLGAVLDRVAFVFEPWDALGESQEPLPFSLPSYEQSASTSLLTLEGNGGIQLGVFDRTTGATDVLADVIIYGWLPRPAGDGAVLLAVAEFGEVEAWGWSRGAGFAPLLNASPNDVVDIQSDGETLAWIQTATAPEPNDNPPGVLFTSPHTTTTDGLLPTQRYDMPPVEIHNGEFGEVGRGPRSAIGGGYYAIYSSFVDEIHVLRFADDRRWIFRHPRDPGVGDLTDITFIDDVYIYYKTEGFGFRQRLDELGDGEPAN